MGVVAAVPLVKAVAKVLNRRVVRRADKGRARPEIRRGCGGELGQVDAGVVTAHLGGLLKGLLPDVAACNALASGPIPGLSFGAALPDQPGRDMANRTVAGVGEITVGRGARIARRAALLSERRTADHQCGGKRCNRTVREARDAIPVHRFALLSGTHEANLTV